MSTLTEHRADSIEHLEHEPECDRCGNPAEFWADFHGCREGVACARCFDAKRLKFEHKARASGCVQCTECNNDFHTFVPQWITKVVPL